MANWILRGLRTRNHTVYRQAFFSFVLPILEYASSAWAPFLVKDVNLLESVLARYSRRVFKRCKVPYTSYTDRLNTWDMETLECRRMKLDIKLLYKFLLDRAHLNNFDLLFRVLDTKTRGHPRRLQLIHTARHDYLLHSFLYRVVYVWNQLPETLVCAQTYGAFSKKLRLVDISNYYESVLRT
jgi:hypothetical protein